MIVAQELERYGVTVNCIAPNARTRMTESAFEMPADASGFDPLAPEVNSPLVVALSADGALRITGQVFHIFGGAVSLPQPWTPRELSLRDDGWDSEALLAELLDRFPDGAAPEGLAAAMERAGDVQKA